MDNGLKAKIFFILCLALSGYLLSKRAIDTSLSPASGRHRAEVIRALGKLPSNIALVPAPAGGLPHAREQASQSAQPPTGNPSEPAMQESPTGDPETDMYYRENPRWAEAWDEYKHQFMAAQAAHRQLPRPPDPPWVIEELLRHNDESGPNPFE